MTIKPAAPPAAKPAGVPAPASAPTVKSPTATIPELVPLSISTGKSPQGARIVIYGGSGVGKTTLAAFLPSPFFLDLEGSTKFMEVAKDKASSWLELRGKLASIAHSPPRGIRTIVVDTASVAEEFAKEHVIATRSPGEKRDRADSIESFGWGKGWKFVFDEFNGLIADLDRIAERGLNVCLVAHETASPVPNPAGEEYIRWEPMLYSGDKKGNSSVRSRIKSWADFVVFVFYDMHVQDGKATGGGSRSIATAELPFYIAKSRTVETSIAYTLQEPEKIWNLLGVN